MRHKWREIKERKAQQRISQRREAFTGTCPVRQHTADGDYVGRCYHSTYAGVCHLHGNVSQWLVEGADLTNADDRLIERPRP